MKPFDALKVGELRQELQARGVVDTTMVKPILNEMLEDILRGVARVPALLLADPSRSLSSLNLDRYEVVASEPLHDLKGHHFNLITELPHVLSDGDVSTQCTHLISCCLAKEKSGADLRRVVIQLFLLLKDLDSSNKILLLLQSSKFVKSCIQVTIGDLLGSYFSYTIAVGFIWSCVWTYFLHQKS